MRVGSEMCIRDSTLPKLSPGIAGAGKRVKEVLKGNESTELYHVTWLPTDWTAGERYPVIIELAGNGPYRNGFGDISTGRPEGSKLGYGISGGRNYIWICLPFIDDTGKKIATSWWGRRPGHGPRPAREGSHGHHGPAVVITVPIPPGATPSGRPGCNKA